MIQDDKMERNKKMENPFDVPAGYFEDLPRKINGTINILENENKVVYSPFDTPDNYFEKLSHSISDKISERKTSFFKRRIVWIPAACALLMAAFFYLSHTKEERKMYTSSDAEIENSTLLQSIDEDMLIDELASYQLNSETDSLTQYIIDYNIDQFDLENAL
jgi:hypothetical protein